MTCLISCSPPRRTAVQQPNGKDQGRLSVELVWLSRVGQAGGENTKDSGLQRLCLGKCCSEVAGAPGRGYESSARRRDSPMEVDCPWRVVVAILQTSLLPCTSTSPHLTLRRSTVLLSPSRPQRGSPSQRSTGMWGD